MRVSALWITKNEAANIGRSIESAMDIADEIVVVDTGSTDETVEIAKKLGARIEYFEWVNDFSAARNYALEQVSGDIVVFPDADEWFEPKLSREVHRAVIEKQFYPSGSDLIKVERVNVDEETGLVVAVDSSARIMRGKKHLFYKGIIHEQQALASGKRVRHTVFPEFRMIHNGYNRELSNDKMLRNKKLLAQAVDTQEESLDKTLNMFYLLRESDGLKHFEDAFSVLQYMLTQHKRTKEFMKFYSGVVQTFVSLAITTGAKFRTSVSRKQIQKVVLDNFEEVMKGEPLAYMLRLYYDVHFDYKEEEFLDKIEDCYLKAESVRETQEDNLGMQEYLLVNQELFTVAARAAWFRGDKEKAFDYATKALKQVESFLRPDAISLVLRCVKGLPNTDVILFLNSILSVEKSGTLEMLLATLQFEGHKDTYVYYMKKMLDLGKTKKSDYWYLMILLGKYSEVIAAVMADKDGELDEIAQRTVFLAIICADDKKLMADVADKLGMYKDVLLSFFAKRARTDLDKLVAANYQQIAFAAGRPLANRFVKLFSGQEYLALVFQADYYFGAGLYAELLQEMVEVPTEKLQSSTYLMLSEANIMAGQHEAAYNLLLQCLDKFPPSDMWFNICDRIVKLASGALSRKAKQTYQELHPLYETWVRLADMMVSGYALEADTKKQRRELAKMEPADLDKMIANQTKKSFPYIVDTFYNAAIKLENSKAYYETVQCCCYLINLGEYTNEAYEILLRVFEQMQNAQMAVEIKSRLQAMQNALDDEFSQLMEKVGAQSEKSLLDELVHKFSMKDSDIQAGIEDYANKYKMWGSMHYEKKDYQLLEQRAKTLFYNKADYEWLYDFLKDYNSKAVLLAYLKNIADFDFKALRDVRDDRNLEYFDKEIIQCSSEEVFVDLGAFDGDTVENYIKIYGENCFKQIYCYEVTPFNIAKLNQKFGENKRIEIRQKGAFDKADYMYIENDEGVASSNHLMEDGKYKVETVALDDDIQQAITFLKMDIEGGEQKAIRGAENHIKNNKPKLAISIYHSNEDVWKIPRMIDEICPGYSFHLSYHGGDMMPSELTLLAVYPE